MATWLVRPSGRRPMGVPVQRAAATTRLDCRLGWRLGLAALSNGVIKVPTQVLGLSPKHIDCPSHHGDPQWLDITRSVCAAVWPEHPAICHLPWSSGAVC